VHVVAYEIAPHQNGMVAIMIPQIRFSDRPLTKPSNVRTSCFMLARPGTPQPTGIPLMIDHLSETVKWSAQSPACQVAEFRHRRNPHLTGIHRRFAAVGKVEAQR